MNFFKTTAVSALLLSLSVVGLAPDAHAEETYTTKSKIILKQDTSGETPVDPLNPGETIKPEKPGTQGPLSIDIATDFEFELGKVSTKDAIYKANPALLTSKADEEVERPHYVQITDKRGGQKGWTLSLTQDGQFQTADEKTLEGAQIKIKNIETVSTPGTAANSPSFAPSIVELDASGASTKPILGANKDEGGGTWIARFGDLETMADSVELHIPGVSVQEADSYTTDLIWSISDIPANEEL